MKKEFAQSLLIGLLTGAAFGVQAAEAPTSASKASPDEQASVTNLVNPLTGKPLNYEEKQRTLETAKLDSAIYEERFKQEQVKASIEMVPARKKAELKKLEVDSSPKAADLRLPSIKDPIKLPKMTSTPIAARPAESITGLPSMGMPTQAKSALRTGTFLVSVFKAGERLSALVEHNGATYLVSEGETVAGLSVEEITGTSAKVNGRVYSLEDSKNATVAYVDKQTSPMTNIASSFAPVPQNTPLPMPPLPAQSGGMPAMYR